MTINNAEMPLPIAGSTHAKEAVEKNVWNSPAVHVHHASVPPPKFRILFQRDVSDIFPMLRTRWMDDLIRSTTTWETNGETNSRKNTPVQMFHNVTIFDLQFSRTNENIAALATTYNPESRF